MLYSATPLLETRSFRIMHLLAGNDDDPIRFSLQPTACDADPYISYEALSYVWGDPTLTQEIFCEGLDIGTSCSLMVTTNCYNALKSLRLPGKTRTLWIDAICINQGNVEERETQVAMMQSIYSGASQVVVYLGESNDDSDSIMRYAKDRYEPIEFPRREIIPNPSAHVWWTFSSRAWFTRTWVLQELFCAQRIEMHCGRMSISWKALADYYNEWYSRALRQEFHVPAAYKVVRFISWARRPNNEDLSSRLLELLTRTRWCASSDPRDKLYGIISMLGTDGDMPLLKPNYRRSANELFTYIALFLYGQFGSEMFKHASRSSLRGGLELLPTWVPDWTCPGVFGFEEARGGSGRKWEERPMAGGQSLSGAQPYECPSLQQDSPIRQLSVKGLLVDTLAISSDECDLDKNLFPLAQWRNIALGPSSSDYEIKHCANSRPLLKEGPAAKRMEEFQRLLANDNVVYDSLMSRALDFILEWEKHHSNNMLTTHLTGGGWPPSYLRQILQFLKCCDKRKLGILNNGLMALIPVFAEPEDLVFVLPGASVPFLFRKQHDHYVFIGECFVQGIMFGEAWDGKSPDSLETLIVE